MIIKNYELWRLWTPAFLHYSFANLLINIFAFLYFAPRIEHTFGIPRFLGLTLLIPPVSILFSLSYEPNSLTIVTFIYPVAIMAMKLGWLIVNTRECCASTLI